MRFFTSRLDRKILLIVFTTLFVVATPVIVFELSNTQREIYRLNEKSWDLFTEAVFKSVETIMLEGRADIANDLLMRFQQVREVEGLDIVRMNGTKAYTAENIKLLDLDIIERLKKEERLDIYRESGGKRSLMHLGLLLNKKECARCHGSESPYRGIVIIKTSLGAVERRVFSLWSRIIIAAILASIALLIGIPFAIKKMVIKPLSAVLSVTDEISRGDLTKDISPPSEDEIGSFVKAVNIMKDGLQRLIQKVKDSLLIVTTSTGRIIGGTRALTEGAERQDKESSGVFLSVEDINKLVDDIARSIARLHESVGETASALQEVKASIKEIADNTSYFAKFIEDTSSSIEESFASIRVINEGIGYSKEAINSTLAAAMQLRESVRGIKDSAKESSHLAGEVVTSIKEKGALAIKEAMRGIELIKSSALETTEFIEEMRRSSERIDEIIKIIDEVADSTKLLSLNASILSAQAGEYGKGFGVVADEIGRLAGRTASHTKEIASIIEGVKEGIERVVHGQYKTAHLIETGSELLNKVESIFDGIQKTSTESASQASFIERATEEQAKAIQEISTSLESIFHRMEEIAKASEYQRQGGVQILNGVERIREMATGLENSTSEQTKGVDIIAGAIETILAEVERIKKAMDELRKGGSDIMKRIAVIREVAQRNLELSIQLKEDTERFEGVVETLERDINKFKTG